MSSLQLDFKSFFYPQWFGFFLGSIHLPADWASIPVLQIYHILSHFYLLCAFWEGFQSFPHHQLNFLQNELSFILTLHFKSPYTLSSHTSGLSNSYLSVLMTYCSCFQSDYTFLHPYEDFLKCSSGFHFAVIFKDVFFL